MDSFSAIHFLINVEEFVQLSYIHSEYHGRDVLRFYPVFLGRRRLNSKILALSCITHLSHVEGMVVV